MSHRSLPQATTYFRDGHTVKPTPKGEASPFERRKPTTTEGTDGDDTTSAVYGMLLHEYERKRDSQQKADDCWSAWLDGTRDGSKDGWQSNLRLPRTWILVERSVAALMDFVKVAPQWFDIGSVNPQQELAATVLREILLYDMQDDRLGNWGVIEDGLRELLLTGSTHLFPGFEADSVPMMNDEPLPEEEEAGADLNVEAFSVGGGSGEKQDGKEPKVRDSRKDPLPFLKLVPFERAFRDSTGGNRYVIWTSYMCVGDFRKQGEAMGWDDEMMEKAISSRGGQGSWGTMGNEWRDIIYGEKGVASQGGDFEYAIEATNFHGTLYDTGTGEIVFENKYFVAANGFPMMEPRDSPFWDDDLPLIQATISRNPKSAYGRSPIFETLDTTDLSSRMLLSAADGLQRQLDPSYVVDKSVITENMRNKPMGPGVVYDARLNGSQGPGIYAVPTSKMDGNMANILQMLNVQLEGMSTVLQEGGSAPRSRNRMSGTEFAAREQQSSVLLKHFFHSLDGTFFTPIVRKMIQRRLQFTSTSQWTTVVRSVRNKVLFGLQGDALKSKSDAMDEIESWGVRERYDNMAGFLKYTVKIFGNALQRQIKVETFSSLFNVLWRSPEMQKRLNQSYLLSEYVSAMGVDPAKAIIPESQVDVEARPDVVMGGSDMRPPSVMGSAGRAVGLGPDGGDENPTGTVQPPPPAPTGPPAPKGG